MRSNCFYGVVIAFCLSVSNILFAHEIRPGYLELKEEGINKYAVTWKLPVLNNQAPQVYPIFSNEEEIVKLREERTPSALTVYSSLSTSGDLGGTYLKFHNLEKMLFDVLIRIERQSGEVNTMMARPSKPGIVIPVQSGTFQVAKTFGILGIEHILFGWDHLLFVLALILLIENMSVLLTTITSFTIAHSITLASSSLGHMSLPSAPVEIVIALSVIFLAREVILVKKGKLGISARKPWIVAFIFGLLHGFGFAGALESIGLPQHAITSSLLSFNVGVEIGQIVFILLMIGGFFLFKKILKLSIPKWSYASCGYLIGGVSTFWFIDRLSDIVA